MKTPWQVRQTSVAPFDAEKQWDYAHQFLLQWARIDILKPIIVSSPRYRHAGSALVAPWHQRR